MRMKTQFKVGMRAAGLVGLLMFGAGASDLSGAQAQSGPQNGPQNGPQSGAGNEQLERVSFEGVKDHGHLYSKFDMVAISNVAMEMGFKISVIVPTEGPPLYALSDENGAQIMLRPVVCTGSDFTAKCNALLMSVVLSGFPNSNLQRVNAYNDAQFFGRGHIVGGNRAVLSRFLVGEFGVVKGNLAIEVYSFRSAAYNFARFLSADQMSEKPGAPALGGSSGLGSLGSMGVPGTSGLLGEGLDGVDISMPGLETKPESARSSDTIVEALDGLHLLDEFTNDVSQMLSAQ